MPYVIFTVEYCLVTVCLFVLYIFYLGICHIYSERGNINIYINIRENIRNNFNSFIESRTLDQLIMNIRNTFGQLITSIRTNLTTIVLQQQRDESTTDLQQQLLIHANQAIQENGSDNQENGDYQAGGKKKKNKRKSKRKSKKSKKRKSKKSKKSKRKSKKVIILD
jgi:hypothetical protein